MLNKIKYYVVVKKGIFRNTGGLDSFDYSVCHAPMIMKHAEQSDLTKIILLNDGKIFWKISPLIPLFQKNA